MSDEFTHSIPLTSSETIIEEDDGIHERGQGDTGFLNNEIDPPLSLHEQVKGVPFGVEYFGLNNYMDLNEVTDIDKVRDKLEIIEDYVNELITTKGLMDITESYESIMKQIEEMLYFEETETSISKINKVYQMIIMSKKAKEVEKRKSELIEKLYD